MSRLGVYQMQPNGGGKRTLSGGDDPGCRVGEVEPRGWVPVGQTVSPVEVARDLRAFRRGESLAETGLGHEGRPVKGRRREDRVDKRLEHAGIVLGEGIPDRVS